MNDSTTAPSAAAAPSPHDTDWFTDGDELTKMVADSRSLDNVCKSSFEDAKAIVDAFAQETDSALGRPACGAPTWPSGSRTW